MLQSLRHRWLTSTEKVFDTFSGVLALIMTLIVVAQVASRYLLQAMPGVFESVQLMLVAITYLGLSRAQAQGEHISVDAVIHVLPPKWRKLVEMASLILCLVTFGVITFISGRAALNAFINKEAAMGLIPFPLGPSKMFVPIGSALLSVRFIDQLINQLTRTGRTDGLK